MSKHIVARLVESCGSQAALARKVNAPPALVWQWINGARPVSPKFVHRIEEEFGVSRHDLRPDIFGPAPTDKAEAA